MKRIRVFCVAALSGFSSIGAARGQTGGTIFVNFGGGAGTPQGNIPALSIAGLPGLTGAPGNDLTALKAQVLAKMQAAFAGYSVNITGTQPASGAYTRILIGDSAQYNFEVPGLSDDLDFRNKTRSNIGSVAKNSVFASPFFPSDLNGYSNRIAAVASQEAGRALGLTYSDVISTFTSGGAAAVQSSEIMTNHQLINGVAEYQSKSFGEYSRRKLRIATEGINLQTENGQPASFLTPFAADPVRSGDVGGTIGTARLLNFDSNGNVVVLGRLDFDTDVYKFTVTAPTRVTAEIYSFALNLGNPYDRITDPVITHLSIIDSTGAQVVGEQFDANSSFDGPTGTPPAVHASHGSDSIIFNYLLQPGTYGVKVAAFVDEHDGNYELYVNIPSPGSVSLLIGGTIVAVRRGRRHA